MNYIIIYYHMSTSRKGMGVMGKPCSCMQFIKSCIFYCKSCENPYQYYKSREIEGSYDKIIITIVPGYTGKKYHSFVAVGIALS